MIEFMDLSGMMEMVSVLVSGRTLQAVRLAIDKSSEDAAELKAYEEYLAELRRQARKKKKRGLLGTVLGAIGGFLIGGPAGMIAGMTVGGQTGKWSAAHDDYKDNKRELNKHIWQGGKFNAGDTKTLASDLRDHNKDLRDATYLDIGLDIISAGMGVKGAGGFGDKASRQAFRDLGFKDKLGTAMGKQALTQTKAAKSGDKLALKALDSDKLNILDIIEKQHSILDPKQVALSGGNMYRPGGLFQGGFFPTIMDLAGGMGMQNPQSPIGRLVKQGMSKSAVKRGDLDLATYFATGGGNNYNLFKLMGQNKK